MVRDVALIALSARRRYQKMLCARAASTAANWLFRRLLLRLEPSGLPRDTLDPATPVEEFDRPVAKLPDSAQ